MTRATTFPAANAPYFTGGVSADAFWRSLHYFSLYRLIIAAVFLVAFILTGGVLNLGSQAPSLFQWTGYAYLLLAFCFLFILRRFHWAFNFQLTIQVACDVLALTLMMHASGGAKSGIAIMLLVVLAGAGLVGQGRLTVFYAALATLAVLFEQAFRFLHLGAGPEDFVRTGLTSIGFFATAIIARLLAGRIVANEELAHRRGIELAEQLRINQQQTKLAALGRLTANIAHEIRNPLAAISHAAELLPEEPHADRQERLIRIIADNVGRLNRLVSEILELGRRDRARPEPVVLVTFLRQFIDEYAIHDPVIRSRVFLDSDEDVVLCFDRAHLHRVIENLLTNALRHAGTVRLEARWTSSTRQAELYLSDDGPGIPESARGQVFEPFFTTHGSGTGLGLYIARELCDANGARLELLESVTGARFRIIGRRGECPSILEGGVKST